MSAALKSKCPLAGGHVAKEITVTGHLAAAEGKPVPVRALAGKSNTVSHLDKPAGTDKPDHEPVTPPEDEYTPLDAAQDQIEGLQAALVVANMGDVPEEDKTQAATYIADMQAEIKTLRINIRAVTISRDGFMNELAHVKRYAQMQRREIAKLTGRKTDHLPPVQVTRPHKNHNSNRRANSAKG